MKQSELIKQMTDKDLKKSLVFSQALFVLISGILSIILFENMSVWLTLFDLDIYAIVYYGVIPGLVIVLVDLILMYVLPKHHFDDGGINEKLFRSRSIGDIFMIALIVAISEELLFRGVIQTVFGFLIASIVFTLVHIRYLKKPVLLISVLCISFYIGYLFELTGNLYVTITVHFIVDFLLGLVIRFQK